jgi:hypothetical protein
MYQIGKVFGGNRVDSAKLGREKVRDGLLFAKLVFDDLIREERECGRMAKSEKIPFYRFALGPDADGFPLKWRQAENDNRRGITDVF